jgi:hypothetical protein
VGQNPSALLGQNSLAEPRATNCHTDDPGWVVKEILATQARNTRSLGEKSYHLVVSFPEGEKPTREQIEDIEDRLCAALGFEEHQRVSAVHQNTDNWHFRIAINKVHRRAHGWRSGSSRRPESRCGFVMSGGNR